MIDQEMLQALGALMDQKLQPITARLESIEDRLEAVEESVDEVRSGVNTLLEWAEKSSRALEFPLPKVIE